MDDRDDWGRWIQALRGGDEEALRAFWARYATPLLQLAGQNLQQKLRRRVDPEDVVQSALRAFLRRARDDDFDLPGPDDLWGLLCAITRNKARGQARFHGREKRAVHRDQTLEPGESGQPSPEPMSREPSPLESATLVDLVEQVVSGARDEEEARLVLLKLEGFSHDEIAERCSCSERTVRRILGRVRERLEIMLDAS
ncbi:MAG: RNA polymerase sigma factor [Isosphaeraceae bacterium]